MPLRPRRCNATRLSVIVLVMIGILGWISPALAQPTDSKKQQIAFKKGPPDLVLHMSASKSSIYGGYGAPNVYTLDTTLITISLENRFTPARVSLFPGIWSGSAVDNVFVYVSLTPRLQQFGNISVSRGFQYIIVPGNKVIIIFGETIPAGESAIIQIEVGALEFGCSSESVSAEVDPFHMVAEVSETNNSASLPIEVWCLK